MVSLLRKRRPMVLASGSSPSFPLADLAVPRKLLPQRSFWLRMRVVMYSAMTWLSMVEPPLSKGLTWSVTRAEPCVQRHCKTAGIKVVQPVGFLPSAANAAVHYLAGQVRFHSTGPLPTRVYIHA